VADPFGDRCSTGERLLPVRLYEGAQPHTCRHGTARHARGVRHDGRTRMNTLVGLARGETYACENESRVARREPLKVQAARVDFIPRCQFQPKAHRSSGSVTKWEVILSLLYMTDSFQIYSLYVERSPERNSNLFLRNT